MKRYIAVVMGLIVAVALAAPVRAAVTVTLVAKPPNYSGTCPTTIQFSGKLTSANAYTNVTPKFTRSDGTSATTPTQVIFTAGGSVAIIDSMPVKSTVPAGFDRVEVSWTYVQSGQIIKGTSTTQAPFAVDCSPGGVSDFLKKLRKISSAPFLVNVIAAPTNLRTTNNPQDCPPGPLGAIAIACAAAIQNGELVFMWDWSPGPGPTDITGYRLYQLAPRSTTMACRACSGRTLVATQDSGPDTMLKPAKPTSSACYAVRAYKGSDESVDSNPKCLGAGVSVGSKTLDVFPTVVTATGYNEDWGAPPLCPGLGPVGIPAYVNTTPNVIVGYDHFNSTAKCLTADTFYRGVMTFPVGNVAHKPILKARLLFKHVNDQFILGTGPGHAGFEAEHAPVSCTRGLYIGDNEIVEMPWGTPGESVNQPPLTINAGKTFAVDVTDLVREWANNGVTSAVFSLRGPNEAYAEDNDKCTTTYGDFVISVETF